MAGGVRHLARPRHSDRIVRIGHTLAAAPQRRLPPGKAALYVGNARSVLVGVHRSGGGRAIAFGVMVYAWPAITLAALVVVYGVYAFADGVFLLVKAIGSWKAREDPGYCCSEGCWVLALAS